MRLQLILGILILAVQLNLLASTETNLVPEKGLLDLGAVAAEAASPSLFGSTYSLTTEISTIVNGQTHYTLTLANFPLVLQAIAVHKQTHLAAGRVEQDAIMAMTTLQDVLDYEDPRLVALRGG